MQNEENPRNKEYNNSLGDYSPERQTLNYNKGISKNVIER